MQVLELAALPESSYRMIRLIVGYEQDKPKMIAKKNKKNVWKLYYKEHLELIELSLNNKTLTDVEDVLAHFIDNNLKPLCVDPEAPRADDLKKNYDVINNNHINKIYRTHKKYINNSKEVTFIHENISYENDLNFTCSLFKIYAGLHNTIAIPQIIKNHMGNQEQILCIEESNINNKVFEDPIAIGPIKKISFESAYHNIYNELIGAAKLEFYYKTILSEKNFRPQKKFKDIHISLYNTKAISEFSLSHGYNQKKLLSIESFKKVQYYKRKSIALGPIPSSAFTDQNCREVIEPLNIIPLGPRDGSQSGDFDQFKEDNLKKIYADIFDINFNFTINQLYISSVELDFLIKEFKNIYQYDETIDFEREITSDSEINNYPFNLDSDVNNVEELENKDEYLTNYDLSNSQYVYEVENTSTSINDIESDDEIYKSVHEEINIDNSYIIPDENENNIELFNYENLYEFKDESRLDNLKKEKKNSLFDKIESNGIYENLSTSNCSRFQIVTISFNDIKFKTSNPYRINEGDIIEMTFIYADPDKIAIEKKAKIQKKLHNIVHAHFLS